MDEAQLDELLAAVAAGRVSPDDAVAALRRLPFVELAHSRIDHHRALRTGQAEVVYGPGKTVTQCVEIVGELLGAGEGPVSAGAAGGGAGQAAAKPAPSGGPVLVTRASGEQETALLEAFPGGEASFGVVVWRTAEPRTENVVIASAGTSDGPVAGEAAATLAAHGVKATSVVDIGVAGLHRFLAEVDTLAEADLVIVVAGMEGALATAVGGVTSAPVIAVPTSTGYGAALEGVTALLAMLSSCASGLSVVGIDNGFGAAMAALRILDVGGGALGAHGKAE